MELINRLWAHLRASPDNVVVIMRNNIIVSTALLSLTVTGVRDHTSKLNSTTQAILFTLLSRP